MSITEFVVGITGHRDLDPTDCEQAAHATRDFLTNLSRHLPDIEILVMSGLADGADRLASSVALEMGLRVLAVLPMPQQRYEEDFATESLAEFRELLAAPGVETFELNKGDLPDRVTGEDRDACYRSLTDCLIRKSNILLTFWDGIDTRLAGGTSDTLKSFLTNTQEIGEHTARLELGNAAPVHQCGQEYAFWIPVRRASQGETAQTSIPDQPVFLSGVEDTQVLIIHQTMPQLLEEQLRELNEYCTDFSELSRWSDQLPTWGLPEISDESRSADPEGLLDRIESDFRRADSLAIFYQSKSDRLFKSFSMVAAVLGFLFLVYAKLVASSGILYAYIALFTGGYITFKLTASRHWFTKHIMYRVIAETLRIKFFLRLARADDLVNVFAVARLAGINRFPGFGWILQAYKATEPIVLHPNNVVGAGTQIEDARQLWVNDQSAYFSKKIHYMHPRHRRVERIKAGMLLATLVAIAVLIMFKYPLMTEIPGTELQYKKLLVFFVGLFPFWVAVWELYHNKMATKELLWQYRNQSDVFALAEFQLDRAGNIERQRKVMADLATKALFENYLWTIHRIHREHEPPAGG